MKPCLLIETNRFARAEKSHYQELELASSFLIKAKTARLEELEELMRNVHRLVIINFILLINNYANNNNRTMS